MENSSSSLYFIKKDLIRDIQAVIHMFPSTIDGIGKFDLNIMDYSALDALYETIKNKIIQMNNN